MPKILCTIEGCTTRSQRAGLCHRHHRRQTKYGNPLISDEMATLAEYWARVDTSGGPDSCWPWVGHRRYGYGIFSVHSKEFGAHRWGYEHRVGSIPEGHGVLHHCDNPPCQNDRHWFTGTQVDNNNDKMRKGRQRNVRGALHRSARLTEDDVRSIRLRYASGETSQLRLAQEFHVAEPTIWKIVNRKIWSHVSSE